MATDPETQLKLNELRTHILRLGGLLIQANRVMIALAPPASDGEEIHDRIQQLIDETNEFSNGLDNDSFMKTGKPNG
jgi:hypothetical protein